MNDNVSARRRIAAASRKQEKDGAKRHGAKTTVASGSKDSKNDATSREVSIEFKQTGRLSYVLKLDDLLNASRYAVREGKRMILGLEFRNARDPSRPRRYVVEEESDYLELLLAFAGLNKEVAYLQGLVAQFEDAERERNTQDTT